ncbi:MAG: D-alanine--D-alanine ligase [Firmicutes bacterium]|nr:D-alanine--D-alanine ligase [Bacillota bacterium]
MMLTKRIGVLMGGPSAEREVSLNTGRAILQGLQEKGYQAVGIDLDPPRFFEQMKEAGIDIVFNAIHGIFGEDGRIQGALELLGIPYTGSGVLASAMAMDKGISKRLFVSAGVPTPKSQIYEKTAFREGLAGEVAAEFGVPVVVKPVAQGSSIGVFIVDKAADLAAAMQDAWTYSDQILIEEFIKGRELTVAVLADETVRTLPIIEIVPCSGRYDYHSKYTKGATEYIVPASLGEAAALAAQQAAIGACRVLGCRGVARVDIILDQQERPYVLEVNTIPGMTATSLVPKAAAAVGISFPDLCEQILRMAVME